MADCGDDVAAELVAADLREEIKEARVYLEGYRQWSSGAFIWSVKDYDASGEFVRFGCTYGNNEVAMAFWKDWIKKRPNCVLTSKPTPQDLHLRHVQQYHRHQEKLNALEAKLASLC